MRILLSNQIVDQRLLNANRYIQRIGNYTGIHCPTEWKCLINNCNHIWIAEPNSVINRSSGCPKCYGNARLNNDIVDCRLEKRSIQRIGNINGNAIKIDFRCLIVNCNYVWQASPSNILDNNAGCPKCAKVVKLTNEIIDKRLINRPIKRIGSIINATSKIDWECLNKDCYCIWTTAPNNIINNNSGCPNCNSSGMNEKLIKSILEQSKIEFEYQKPIKQLNYNEIKNYRVDFYLTKPNLIIEYNGAQHYKAFGFGSKDDKQIKNKFVKQQARDIYIRDFCQINNIKLLEIDGRKFKNNSLKEYIIQMVNKGFTL